MNLFQSALGCTIIASILYGLNGPLMKIASTAGASSSGLTLMYGIGCLIIAFFGTGNASMFPTTKSFLLAASVGIVCGTAFYVVGKAFSLPGGSVSMITTIIAAHCLVSALIAIVAMGELSHIHIGKFLFGATLVLLGVYVVSTSSKSA